MKLIGKFTQEEWDAIEEFIEEEELIDDTVENLLSKKERLIRRKNSRKKINARRKVKKLIERRKWKNDKQDPYNKYPAKASDRRRAIEDSIDDFTDDLEETVRCDKCDALLPLSDMVINLDFGLTCCKDCVCEETDEKSQTGWR